MIVASTSADIESAEAVTVTIAARGTHAEKLVEVDPATRGIVDGHHDTGLLTDAAILASIA
jgi:hypothetical protein